MTDAADVRVRGNASAEELAAVVALISQLERPRELDRYSEWRRGRLAAITRTQQRSRADRRSP